MIDLFIKYIIGKPKKITPFNELLLVNENGDNSNKSNSNKSNSNKSNSNKSNSNKTNSKSN